MKELEKVCMKMMMCMLGEISPKKSEGMIL